MRLLLGIEKCPGRLRPPRGNLERIKGNEMRASVPQWFSLHVSTMNNDEKRHVLHKISYNKREDLASCVRIKHHLGLEGSSLSRCSYISVDAPTRGDPSRAAGLLTFAPKHVNVASFGNSGLLAGASEGANGEEIERSGFTVTYALLEPYALWWLSRPTVEGE